MKDYFQSSGVWVGQKRIGINEKDQEEEEEEEEEETVG